MNHTPTPWTVYQCSFAKQEDPDRACGINGESLDFSNDECHHTLTLADAAFIVRAVNAHEDLIAACKLALRFSLAEQVRDVVQEAIAKAEGK